MIYCALKYIESILKINEDLINETKDGSYYLEQRRTLD